MRWDPKAEWASVHRLETLLWAIESDYIKRVARWDIEALKRYLAATWETRAVDFVGAPISEAWAQRYREMVARHAPAAFGVVVPSPKHLKRERVA